MPVSIARSRRYVTRVQMRRCTWLLIRVNHRCESLRAEILNEFSQQAVSGRQTLEKLTESLVAFCAAQGSGV